MSSINFTAPSAEEVKKFPREFALLTQIPGYERGTLSSDVSPDQIRTNAS